MTALRAKLNSIRRDLVLVGLVGLLAIILTVFLAASSPATAGPLILQSSVSPLIEPTIDAGPPAPETPERPVLPEEQVTETPSPDQPAVDPSKPPMPIGFLAGTMVAIGIIALIIALNRG